MKSEYNIEELKRNFLQYFENELPQRAKGISYQRIIGVTVISFMILTFFVCLPFYMIMTKNFLYLLGVLMVTLFFILPEYFYHEIKRSKRWVKRNYPKIYEKIYTYSEREKKDRMVVNPCLLIIEGEEVFFGTYSHQGVRDSKSTLTGYVLLSIDGELIEDEELFKKAFLTYNYSIIGAVSGQTVANKEWYFISENVKRKMRRAEKIIRAQQKFFELSSCKYDWNHLLVSIPDLIEAGKAALAIYDAREKFRKSMGYSFGYAYQYEDAVLEYEMRQAYCKYMYAEHYKTINNTRVYAAHIIKQIEHESRSIKKRFILKTVKKIWTFAFTLSNLLEKMAQQGIPSGDDISLFHQKTCFAKSVKK